MTDNLNGNGDGTPTPPEKPFSERWNFDSPDHKRNIAIYSTLDKGTVGVGLWMLVRSGLGPWGWGLAAAWTATSYMAQGYIKEKAVKFFDDILRDNTVPAGDDLQQIAERLFEKGGIKDMKPVVRVIDMGPGSGKLQAMSSSAMTLPDSGKFGLSAPDEILICVGKKTLETLTREEVTAVLAHEVAHNLVNPPSLQDVFNKAATASNNGVYLGKIFTGGWKRAMPVQIATNLARRVLFARAKKNDEERADRNAVALYPHQTALKTALDKLGEEMRKIMKVDQGSVQDLWMKAQKAVFGAHPMPDERAAAIDAAYAEVSKFYQDEGIPMDLDAVSGPSDVALEVPDVPNAGSFNYDDVVKKAKQRLKEMTEQAEREKADRSKRNGDDSDPLGPDEPSGTHDDNKNGPTPPPPPSIM